MAENKKIVLDDINDVNDLTNWILNVELDTKDLYNKGNQEQYSKFIANVIEKLKLTKEELIMFLNMVTEKSNEETRIIIFFILCLSYQYKYVAYMRDFLINYSTNFIDDYVISDLRNYSNDFNSKNLQRFIDSIYNNLKNKNKDISAQDSFILIFSILKLINNSGNRMYKDRNILLIERELLEFFCEKYNKNSDIKIDNYIAGDIMGQQVKDETFVKNLIKYFYLYDGLSERINSLEDANYNLLTDKNNMSNKILTLKDSINNLETIIKQKNNEINVLKEELNESNESKTIAENRLEFEKNKYEQGFLSMQSSLLDSLKSDLELEIEGIQDIIEFLPEEKKNKIARRLKRIQLIIDERLGE